MTALENKSLFFFPLTLKMNKSFYIIYFEVKIHDKNKILGIKTIKFFTLKEVCIKQKLLIQR